MKLLLFPVSLPLMRAVLNGDKVEISTRPFAAALLFCADTGPDVNPELCATLCSGSLISPNAVLTAAHCAQSVLSCPTHREPVVPFANFFVLLGSNGANGPIESGSKLVQVVDFRSAGFGTNPRFKTDDDVAILKLAEPVEYTDTIQPIKLKSMIPPACSEVTVVGFGRESNIPDDVREPDGHLRETVQSIESFDVCQSAFVEASVRIPLTLAQQTMIEQFLIPEKHFCQLSVTPGAATCNGDSGGAVIARAHDGSWAQIGVVASVPGQDKFCGGTIDITSRLGPYKEVIMETVEEWALPVSGGVPSVFKLNDSPPSWVSDRMKDFRCAVDKWQCGSGECIQSKSVCDGTAQCADLSDESPKWCGHLHPSVATDVADKPEMEHSVIVEEFNELAEKSAKVQRLWNVRSIRVRRDASDPQTSLLGVLSSAGRPKRFLRIPEHGGKGAEEPSFVNHQDWCDTEFKNLQAALELAKASTDMTDTAQVDLVGNACDMVSSCFGGPKPQTETQAVCADMQELRSFVSVSHTYRERFHGQFNSQCVAHSESEPVATPWVPDLGLPTYIGAILALLLLLVFA